jgi:hypothetical protein
VDAFLGGRSIRTGCEASAESIVAAGAEVVIVATGAVPRVPEIDGVADHHVVSAWDVLKDGVDGLGQVVLVIDEEYGHQGPTTAEFLLDRGKEVDLITSQETIANFLGATTRPPLLRRLFLKRAQLFTHLDVRQLKDNCAVARNIWTGELHEVGPYESFVYAYGGKSVDTLSAALSAQGVEVRVIGDAFAPRSLQHAILEGHCRLGA